MIDPTLSKLKVHNTLTRSLEEFTPNRAKRVNMFVCGPTVWDASHVGHAKTYVAYDIMARYLRRKGYSVFFILNITDVDDKIINRARKENEDPLRLAEKYAHAFFKDMKDINVNSINLYANASDHIPEIISQVQGLLDKGIGYRIEGDVYFDIRKFPDYGKLSKLKLDDLTVHRVDPDPRKRHPGDFVLWKSHKPGEVSWDSPWGKGRPGWHIEDTAITLTYFGPSYDIHGGGNDLIFPHHEAEIAEAEALTGKEPLAKYWLHTGLLNVKGQEMHKTFGNTIPIQDAIQKNGSDALRILYASTHYRSPLDFTEEALDQAGSLARRFKRVHEQLTQMAESVKTTVSSVPTFGQLDDARDEFFRAMDDDFNTPAALTAYIRIVGLAEAEIKNPKPVHTRVILDSMEELSSVLGVLEPAETTRGRIPELVGLLMELRTELRARREYELADKIRNRMEKMGLLVEDNASETRWIA